ncbi:nitroreductase/quinone reductase family protein [Jatrophihabitans endophyticus]|uniref:nitroreductase/quinone reductase family protein n=1 Tax=Jatrophihabitans endophyticus TaxID=1206085 RepID=UPI0019F0A152|nr:nitroreductase/quinone reductase family protein [Jatrophihabitans endophyticus]MBE7187413.1 nitroreductase family deazaflavin-dependent oxidoreductase [Jatrophihabitans endophyticus]
MSEDKGSLSGRGAHFLVTHLPFVNKMMTRTNARVFERSGGRRGATLGGKPVFRLTITGRTSGQPRTVMLMLVPRGDELLVCGSQAGTPQAPNWWKNLEAAGRATAQVGSDTFEVTSRVVTDEAERAEAWTMLTDAYPDFATYQKLTDRVLPIAVLTRAG